MKDDQWVDSIQERIKMDETQRYIDVLKAEIDLLTSRLEPHDMGHLHTAIGVLTHRIKELEILAKQK
ncbi:MAG: hypothetical protein QGH83_16090 [Candidatus Pacebacteria bacterium]|jgi:hypothetical protein|nr:hypothetical protein [Candidatus Paceibacterota bacterium]|tara:strand:- start:488 stop:688 length:201 start_codon:yes stop_codon:yes gene_type:complete